MTVPDFERAGWRKSSRSCGAQNCVEVARTATLVAVRDTKSRASGMVTFDVDRFEAFLDAVKAGH